MNIKTEILYEELNFRQIQQVMGLHRYYSATFSLLNSNKFSYARLIRIYMVPPLRRRFLVARTTDNLVLGYCHIYRSSFLDEPKDFAEIVVRPAFSRIGIGKSLIEEAMKRVSQKIFVEFFEITKPSMPHHENTVEIFFQKNGFAKLASNQVSSKFGVSLPIQRYYKNK